MSPHISYTQSGQVIKISERLVTWPLSVYNFATFYDHVELQIFEKEDMIEGRQVASSPCFSPLSIFHCE